MSQTLETINVGAFPGDPNSDSTQLGFEKCNANFTTLEDQGFAPTAPVEFAISNGTTAGIAIPSSLLSAAGFSGALLPLSFFEDNETFGTSGIFLNATSAALNLFVGIPTFDPAAIMNAGMTGTAGSGYGLHVPRDTYLIGTSNINFPDSGDLYIIGEPGTMFLSTLSNAGHLTGLWQNNTNNVKRSGKMVVRNISSGKVGTFEDARSGLPSTDYPYRYTLYHGDRSGLTQLGIAQTSDVSQSSNLTLYIKGGTGHTPAVGDVVAQAWYCHPQANITAVTPSGPDFVCTIDAALDFPIVTRCQVPVILSGVPGTTITNGQVEDRNGNFYTLPTPLTFPLDPDLTSIRIYTYATAVATGWFETLPGMINTISGGTASPAGGWLGVENTKPTCQGPTWMTFFKSGTAVPYYSGGIFTFFCDDLELDNVKAIGWSNGLALSFWGDRRKLGDVHCYASSGTSGAGGFRFYAGDGMWCAPGCGGTSGDDMWGWVPGGISTKNGIVQPSVDGDLPLTNQVAVAPYGCSLRARAVNSSRQVQNGAQFWSWTTSIGVPSTPTNVVLFANGSFPTSPGSPTFSLFETGNGGGGMGMALAGYGPPGSTINTITQIGSGNITLTLNPAAGFAHAFPGTESGLSYPTSMPGGTTLKVFNGPSFGCLSGISDIVISDGTFDCIAGGLQHLNGDGKFLQCLTARGCQFDQQGNVWSDPTKSDIFSLLGSIYGGLRTILDGNVFEGALAQTGTSIGKNELWFTRNFVLGSFNPSGGGVANNNALQFAGMYAGEVSGNTIFATPGGSCMAIGLLDNNNELGVVAPGWTKNFKIINNTGRGIAAGSYMGYILYSSGLQVIGNTPRQGASGGRGFYYDSTSQAGGTLTDGSTIQPMIFDLNMFDGVSAGVHADSSISTLALAGFLNLPLGSLPPNVPFFGPTTPGPTGQHTIYSNSGTLEVGT